MTRSFASIDHDACGVGFVAQLGSSGSREVVERALEALRRLGHRGGLDADGRSGDGAGLLTAIPDGFVRNCAREAGIALPPVYALGMVFLPAGQADSSRDLIAKMAESRGLRLLGWRIVPTDPSIVGPRALETLPVIQQCFFAPVGRTCRFGIRSLSVAASRWNRRRRVGTYFCSLSSRTVVYKGLLTPEQLPAFYSDLTDPEFASPFAIFHQRYSTNTQPQLVAGAAIPFRGPQWRDQYDQREPPMASSQGSFSAPGSRTSRDGAIARGAGERLRQLRQWAGNLSAPRLQPGGRDVVHGSCSMRQRFPTLTQNCTLFRRPMRVSRSRGMVRRH